MEVKDDPSCDLDSDIPICVGQSLVTSEQNRDELPDEAGESPEAPVLEEVCEGEQGSSLPVKKLSDNPPSLDQAESSDDAFNGFSEPPNELRWDEDLDCTLESGCSWVDEYSDDEEILVGHEAKDTVSDTRKECHPEVLNSNSKEYEGNTSELRSSSCIENLTSETFDEQHHHRPSNHDRLNGVNSEVVSTGIQEETPQMLAPNGKDGVFTSPAKVHSCILQDQTSASTPSVKDIEENVPQEKKSEKTSPDIAQTWKIARKKTSPFRCRKQASEGKDVSRANPELQTDNQALKDSSCPPDPPVSTPVGKLYPLRHRRRISYREDNLKAKFKLHAKKATVAQWKELKTPSEEGPSLLVSQKKSPRKNNTKDESEEPEGASLHVIQIISSRKNTEIDEMIGKEQTNLPVCHRTSPRKSKEMNEFEEKKRRSPRKQINEIIRGEGTALSGVQRTSPRKKTDSDEIKEKTLTDSAALQMDEILENNNMNLFDSKRTVHRKRSRIDEMRDETVPSVSDENLTSSHLDANHLKSCFILGKKRATSSNEGNVNIMDLGSDPFSDSDIEESIQMCCSQIYTGAPMFSDSRTGSRKQSNRGTGSSFQNLEDVAAVAKEMQQSNEDSLTERVLNPTLNTNQERESEKRKQNSHNSHSADLDQTCVSSTIGDHDVCKTSKRQRGRKRSRSKQMEATVMENKPNDAGSRNKETGMKQTPKINRTCKTSKNKGRGRKKDIEVDAQKILSSCVSDETSQQAADVPLPVMNTGEVTPVENSDGPTPPEKRPIYRAKRSRTKGKKSASDLINILTAASASALKRVSEAESPPTSMENQESVHTKQKVSSRKGRGASARVTKAHTSRKRKRRSHSLGRDDGPAPSDSKMSAGETMASSAFEEMDRLTKATTDVDPSPEQRGTMHRLESGSHDDCIEDDDEELMNPVLTPDSKAKDLPPAFNVNDVVWAQDPRDKSKWPAVVIEVAGENVSRRVYSVFKTNQNKEQCFQVKSSRYLKPYNCKDKEGFLEKGKGLSEFSLAVDKANDFIMKIGLEKVKSYEDYFKPSDAYVDSPPPSPVYTSPMSPPLIVGHSSPELYPPRSSKANQDVIDVDDDEEEEEGRSLNDSLNSIKSNSCNGASKEITRLKRKWQRKEKRLLEHMKSLQTKEYLFGIQQGKILSERHQWFLSNNQNDKGRLLRGSFGALINEEKRFEMVNYLRDLLTNERNLPSSPSYTIQVAVPEALNFAYQKTNKVGKEEAEQLIHMDGQQVMRDLDLS